MRYLGLLLCLQCINTFAQYVLPEQINDWKLKASEGDTEAQYYLARAYYNGDGIIKDRTEAVNWYRKAAEQGNIKAQVNLAACYANGVGVTKDLVEAVKWCTKAAEQGDVKSQARLGWAYATASGTAKNFTEAIKWWRKAAEQGDDYAQYCLGRAYHNGDGVAKDQEEAIKWWRKAAVQGNTRAQTNLDLAENNRGQIKDSISQSNVSTQANSTPRDTAPSLFTPKRPNTFRSQPPSLPSPAIIYTQPVGGVFVLRFENRRYEIPNQFKEKCAQLIQQSQHSNLKMAYDRFSRSIEEKKKLNATADVAKNNLQKSNNKKDQLELQLSALNGDFTFSGDAQFVNDSISQIINQRQNLANQITFSENDIAKKTAIQESADKVSKDAADKYNKEEADYQTALENFEITMNELRTLATSRGRLL